VTDAARIFRALADPTRRQILEDLKAGPMAAGEIAARFDISAPSISRHLGVLSAAGLVASRRDANRIVYSLLPETLAHTLSDFLSAVCPTQVRERRRRSKGATR
jgi:DNA-binding transcriptional ArsR family regulator